MPYSLWFALIYVAVDVHECILRQPTENPNARSTGALLGDEGGHGRYWILGLARVGRGSRPGGWRPIG